MPYSLGTTLASEIICLVKASRRRLNTANIFLGSAYRVCRRLGGLAIRRIAGLTDRFSHAARRERAERLVSALRPQSVVMVCHGNICRSPFAAAALTRALAGRAIRIESAGFIGPGRPSPANAQMAALARGIDLQSHSSKLIDADLLAADLLVVMEPHQARALSSKHRIPADRILVLGDLDPGPDTARIIDDPYQGSPEVFVACYRRIERCIDALAAQIQPRAR